MNKIEKMYRYFDRNLIMKIKINFNELYYGALTLIRMNIKHIDDKRISKFIKLWWPLSLYVLHSTNSLQFIIN